MSAHELDVTKQNVLKELNDQGVTTFDQVVDKIVASAPKKAKPIEPQFFFCHSGHYCIYVKRD